MNASPSPGVATLQSSPGLSPDVRYAEGPRDGPFPGPGAASIRRVVASGRSVPALGRGDHDGADRPCATDPEGARSLDEGGAGGEHAVRSEEHTSELQTHDN